LVLVTCNHQDLVTDILREKDRKKTDRLLPVAFKQTELAVAHLGALIALEDHKSYWRMSANAGE